MARVPGNVGWGIERPHLRAQNNIITDDTRVPSYPIHKGHLQQLDAFKTLQFTLTGNESAERIDKKHGIDYKIYN